MGSLAVGFSSPYVEAGQVWLGEPMPDSTIQYLNRFTTVGERKVANGQEGKGERIARGESTSRALLTEFGEFGIARGLAVAHVNLWPCTRFPKKQTAFKFESEAAGS